MRENLADIQERRLSMDWKISNGLVAGKNIMSLKQEEAELTKVCGLNGKMIALLFIRTET